MSGRQVEVDGRRLSLSNLDKNLYPEFTKGEVIDYYARIAPVMLPHLKDRPATRIRWPEGVDGGKFFEKNAPSNLPGWVRVVQLPEDGPESGLRMPVVEDTATLTWMANMAALEFHVHQWRLDEHDQPPPSDRLVIDPTYLGIERGSDALIVQITMRAGRTVEKKKALYRAIAGNIHDRLGVRREDVMVVLTENELIDWSFGNGESQYVKD